DLSTILNRICRELALDLGFDRCYVALKNKAGGGATLVALYDREGSSLSPPLALAPDAYPNFHRVVERGVAEEIPSLKESSLSGAERALFGELGSALFVPLVVDGESTGALYFWRQRVGKFEPDLVRLCQTAALVAALAIRKAFDYEALSLAYLGTVDALVKSIEAKNPYTKGHSEGVSHYVELLGQALKMSQDRLARLRRAALLHDLGKLAIPSSLLSKPGPLTEQEREEIRSHPQVGAEIVARAPQLADILPAVRWHHERVDGSGYPDGLVGNQIPLEARIVAIADAFDAMTSDRPYRPRMTKEEALAELEKNAGTQFDARLVKIFRQCLEESEKEKLK
ncbi:MAG: HD domain-containing protein, partial [Bacillota bacterium]|nr:HD domain-containing protein [Bacillota bacterium]